MLSHDNNSLASSTCSRASPRDLQKGNDLLASLQPELQQLLRHALSPLTASQYHKHKVYFIRFLMLANIVSRLWDTDFVRRVALPNYCTFLCRSCSGDTIKTYMHGVRQLYLEHYVPNPLENNFAVKAIIKAQQRRHPGGAHRKLPITIDMLKILIGYSDINNPFEVACICAAIIAFFAFLRKANITVKAGDVWDAHSISRSDVSFDGHALWITLHLTKTRGHSHVDPLRIPISQNPGSPLNPPAWWILHRRLSPASPNEHAFAFRTPDGSTRALLHTDFCAFIRTKLQQGMPNINVSRYSHQSFRRGGATFAFACNVPPVFIKAMGDWLSDCYERYIELDETIRLRVADKFVATLGT